MNKQIKAGRSAKSSGKKSGGVIAQGKPAHPGKTARKKGANKDPKARGRGRPPKYEPGVVPVQKPVRLLSSKWGLVEAESKLLSEVSGRFVSQNEVVEKAIDKYFSDKMRVGAPAHQETTQISQPEKN